MDAFSYVLTPKSKGSEQKALTINAESSNFTNEQHLNSSFSQNLGYSSSKEL